jgi:hypothetical protein
MAGDVPRRSRKGRYDKGEKYKGYDSSGLGHSLLLSERDMSMPRSNKPSNDILSRKKGGSPELVTPSLASVHRIMFKNLVELWKQYTERFAQTWAADDPRRELSSEVQNRLGQLDILLHYLNKALRLVPGDAEEVRRKAELFMQAAEQFRSGDMTAEKYEEFLRDATAKSPEQLRAEVRAWEEVVLFTEAFYFFAWRLVEVPTGSGAFAFDGFSKLEARGIRIVRNHLLQHPEKYKKNFQQSLVVTSNGPVLKTMTVVVRSDTGKVEPEAESVDRGLFVNALELHDEIKERIRKTLE